MIIYFATNYLRTKSFELCPTKRIFYSVMNLCMCAKGELKISRIVQAEINDDVDDLGNVDIVIGII